MQRTGRRVTGIDLSSHPIHLGLGASASSEPIYTGTADWYADYARRQGHDGIEGRLVSLHSFTKSWDAWEMHPHGSEVVLCTAGELTLRQLHADGTTLAVTLSPGQYAINDPGTWHTADVGQSATALFITAGAGTQHRPR